MGAAMRATCEAFDSLMKKFPQLTETL